MKKRLLIFIKIIWKIIYRIGHIDTGIDKELHLKLLNEISQHNYLQAERNNNGSNAQNVDSTMYNVG